MSKRKTRKVLQQNNLPTKLPLWQTAVAFLLMERFNAPEWLWGVFGFFFFIVWCTNIYSLVTQENVDLLNNDD